MTVYYCYELKTLQPLKMGGSGSQADNEPALDYIAGSALRGAFIGAWLKENPGIELHQDSSLRRLWLEGDIRFLNAYLALDGQRSWPFPACFYMDKNDHKLMDEQEQLLPVVNSLDGTIDEGMKRLPAVGFIPNGAAEQFAWHQTKMTAKLHINLRENQTRLYRYEAIAAGQNFIALVAVENEKGGLQSFLKSFLDKIIYLGGSKSNGYGKCQVVKVSRREKNPECQKQQTNFSGILYLYCLSDMLIRDEMGRLSSRIPESILTAGLGVERISLEAAAVQTIVTDGFNHKWGARLPKQQAIQKGSLFKYSYEGNLDLAKAEQLLNQGLGERRVDGFGRVVLLPALKMSWVGKGQTAVKSLPALDLELSQEEHKQVRQILRRVLMQRIRLGLERRILEWSQVSKDNMISSSQLAQWMNLIGLAKGLAPDAGKKEIEQYVLGLEKRPKERNGQAEETERINQKALRSLEKARIGSQVWLKRIRSFVQQADDVDELICFLQLPELSIDGQDMRALVSKKEVYRLNMEMLYQYIRGRRRSADHKGKREEEA